MDALKDAAFAPFDIVIVAFFRGWVFEDSSHEEALHLHGEEGLEDGGWVEAERAGEAVGGGRAKDL